MKKSILTLLTVILLGSISLAQRQVEVVAEVGLTNQTGTMSRTLFTPATSGVFRVNFMIQCTGGDIQNSSALVPTLDWVDGNGPEFYPGFFGVPDGAPMPPYSFVFIIKAKGGRPIVWGIQEQPQDTSTYNVYLALERIGPKVQ